MHVAIPQELFLCSSLLKMHASAPSSQGDLSEPPCSPHPCLLSRAHDMEGEEEGTAQEMQGPTDEDSESEQEGAQVAKRQRVQPSQQQRRQPSQFQGSQQKLRAFQPVCPLSLSHKCQVLQ